MNKVIRYFSVIIIISFVSAQSVDVKDSDSHTLIQINDEGDSGGSITLPDAVDMSSSDKTNKLYNIDGTLNWNGNPIGVGDNPLWTQEGSTIYSNTSNVGIGTSFPSSNLDVNGTSSSKRFISNGLHLITNNTWDLTQGNLAQISFGSDITPITISSDNTSGTYLLIVKKSFNCTDCNIIFLGATVKYPGGVNPKLSSGSNTTDIFTIISEGNNVFYCLGINDLK